MTRNNFFFKYLGNIECIDTLIKYGCDVNMRDADGRPTLYILALENNVSVAKFLLEHSNINVNLPDNEGELNKILSTILDFLLTMGSLCFFNVGRTPLHVSAWQGHMEMVELLVAQGMAKIVANFI